MAVIREPSAWLRQAISARMARVVARFPQVPDDATVTGRLVDDGPGSDSRDPRFCCRCRRIAGAGEEVHPFVVTPHPAVVFIGQFCDVCREREGDTH